jgi:hypothetical protein
MAIMGVGETCRSSQEGDARLVILVITILRLAGATSIVAALRYHARRPSRPLQTIMNC